MRIPALDQGQLVGGERLFTLAAMKGSQEFLAGRQTPTIGINGPFLGPVLRLKAGDRVRLATRNELGYDTTLHWHGLHLPAVMDGGPHQVIKPGATWVSHFEVKQKAGYFWYHSHLMDHTGEQVNRGLAGSIIVDDDESTGLGLPATYGVDDIPLIIQDRRFLADGRFDYLSAMPDMMMGFKGNVILVNGTVSPHLVLQRRRTRLRLLNASSSRIYNIGLENGRSITQIASDGSLLERPVVRRSVRLSPGERAEILVDVEPGATVLLLSYPDRVTGPGRGMMAMGGNDQEFAILQLRGGQSKQTEPPLPARLAEVPTWDPRKANRQRSFVLEMGMMGMGGRGGGGMMGRGGGMDGMMTINGKSMAMGRIDERVPLDSTEIWTIRNQSPLAHPFHIHDIQFRILDRDGRPAQPYEQGLKDTVLVDPGESVRVITQFTDYADALHPYMYHCHILEHEDMGMMGQFLVV